MRELFSIHIPVWEIVVRGTCIYWVLFLTFRFILRRDAGSLGLADILMIVLIADAAQNGMAGDYKTLSEAFVLVGTLAGWNGFFDAMSYRYKWFARFAEPSSVVLVSKGRILRANLRRELLTEEELRSNVRAAGVEDVGQVKRATLEPDGTISVIPNKQLPRHHAKSKGAMPGA